MGTSAISKTLPVKQLYEIGPIKQTMSSGPNVISCLRANFMLTDAYIVSKVKMLTSSHQVRNNISTNLFQ